MEIVNIIDNAIKNSSEESELRFWTILKNYKAYENNNDLLELIFIYRNIYESKLKDLGVISTDNYLKIIELNENSDLIEEIEKYINSKRYIYDSKLHLYKNNIVLDKLLELLKFNNEISNYQNILKDYFILKEKLTKIILKRDTLLKSINKYNSDSSFLNQFFYKKEIEKTNKEINIYTDIMQNTKLSIKKLEKEIDNCIGSIENEYIKKILLLNKDFVFTLNRFDDINPFTNPTLDVTFNDILNYRQENDIYYFIICNIHNIKNDNLKKSINSIKKNISKMNNKCVLSEAKKYYYERHLSSDSIKLINSDMDLIEDILFLRKIHTINGISGIDYLYYIYALNSIKEKGLYNEVVNYNVSKNK